MRYVRAAAAAAATISLIAGASPASAAQVAALWHMNETSGTKMVDANGSNNGTLHNVTLKVPAAPGKGTAYGFNGASSYVSVQSNSSLNPGSRRIKVTIHLQTTSKPASPDWDLIRKGAYTTPGGEFKMEYQPSGQASCGFKGSNYAEMTAGPSLADNKWHTVSCIKDSTSIKVVVDGKTFSHSVVIGPISNTEPVVIGAHPGSEFFKGNLDEASIEFN
jgi:hypothetical protein